jgi:hypothetical protein
MRPLGSPPDEPDPQAYVILTAAVTLSIPNAAEPSDKRRVRLAAFSSNDARLTGPVYRRPIARREHGLNTVQFAQSHARMTVASEGLHSAIVEKRLRHPGHPHLDAHVAQAIAVKTGRGWRLSKSGRDAQIDAAVALAMAVEPAQDKPEQVRLLGWL